MSARDDILQAVRSARPAEVPLPDVAGEWAKPPNGDLAQRFASGAIASGARVVQGARADAQRLVADAYPRAMHVLSTVDGVSGSRQWPASPHELADLDLFVCEATLGVAEQGAVWLPASRLGVHRAALFLATDVVVIVDRASLVATLHDAYARIDVAAESFGLFLAGPSKTADIEQSLVVGAHGAKSLTILLSLLSS